MLENQVIVNRFTVLVLNVRKVTNRIVRGEQKESCFRLEIRCSN